MFKKITLVLLGLCALGIVVSVAAGNTVLAQISGGAAVMALGGALWTMRDKLSDD